MIHKYESNGFYIVLDVNSGGVHLVDKLTYDLLDHVVPPLGEKMPESVSKELPQYQKAELEDAYAELYTLYQNGTLFSADEYAQFADRMGPAPFKSMCLHVSHDCNLRCKYCFASTGDFGGGRKLMDEATGKKAIDFLLENSGTRHNLEMDFFGGEPLMNFDVVKALVKYGRSREKEYNKHFRFTMTTNGVLLDDDSIDFLNREMYNIVLSLDGRKAVHDRMRPTVSGKGSYDIILPKFQQLVKKRGKGQYYVRATYTKDNLDFLNDVKSMADAGFDQISVEPVVADQNLPYALTEADLLQIFSEYDRLAQYVIDRKKQKKEFNFFHFMIDLDQGPCAIKRLRGCSCGNEYVAVTPDGDIYPCHQFVGTEKWKMGNVYDGVIDQKMKEYFSQANVYHKEECKRCWAKFYCSGGCNANNSEYAGDVLKPVPLTCAIEKKRLECAIMIQAALKCGEEN